MLDFNDVGAIFHGILFAYQKATANILGSGAAVFVHPILDIIKKISDRIGINLINSNDLDEVFDNFSKVMPTSGLVKGFRFEKVNDQTYILHVERCAWAKHIHSELKPEDVTCPYALMAMAVFETVTKEKVKLASSKYEEEGTLTTISSI